MTTAGRYLVAGRIPGERLATEVIDSDSAASTGSDVEFTTIDVPVVEGRIYKITIDCNVNGDTSDRYQIRVYEDNQSGAEVMDRIGVVWDGGAVNGMFFHGEAEYTADATETKTFSCNVRRVSGSGDVIVDATGGTNGYVYVDYIRG